jgi:hypothetical protein
VTSSAGSSPAETGLGSLALSLSAYGLLLVGLTATF